MNKTEREAMTFLLNFYIETQGIESLSELFESMFEVMLDAFDPDEKAEIRDIAQIILD